MSQSNHNNFHIENSIITHAAWHGKISEQESEKLLQNKKIYQYLLRGVEHESHYYVSYVGEDMSIRHTAFKIVYTNKGWLCVQGWTYGPYQSGGIDMLINHLMHCEKNLCIPLENKMLNCIASA